tara:strand:+ start:101 stop:463 length:363 start_codon:yes stop_codon:yes gene_type:complete
MAIGGINPSAAASAYSNSQSITGGAAKVTNISNLGNNLGQNDAVSSGADISFADILKQGVQNSLQTMKAGEEMSAKAVTGEANLTDVVQAVTSAELSLQTVVSVRDKMISAYQDIMRMPI